MRVRRTLHERRPTERTGRQSPPAAVAMKTLLILVVAALIAAAQGHTSHLEKVHTKNTHNEAIAEGGAAQQPSGRITNGVTASRGQFPYQVALYVDGRTFCGASLISSRWVLTAAQCAYSASTFTAYLGATVLNANEAGRIVVTTRTKLVHSAFSLSLLANDIALVNLGQDITFTTYIKPVVLASGSELYVNKTARLVGWSKSTDGTQVASQMRYANLTVITNAVCAETYGAIMIRSSSLCAVYPEGVSSCTASVGTPLVDVASGKQIGVLSFWHKSYCEDGAPLGFTRVSSFASWISSNTGIIF